MKQQQPSVIMPPSVTLNATYTGNTVHSACVSGRDITVRDIMFGGGGGGGGVFVR